MSESSPSREDLDNSSGIILIEFGSDFCGYCQAAENLILQALSENPEVKHGPIKILFTPDEETGRGTEKVDLKKFLKLVRNYLKDTKNILKSMVNTMNYV